MLLPQGFEQSLNSVFEDSGNRNPSASEVWLQLALQCADIVVWDWDIHADRIRQSSPIAFRDESSRPKAIKTYEEFLGTVLPEDRVDVDNAVRAAIENDAEYNLVFRMLNEEGFPRWKSVKGKVLRDSEGRARRMTGVCADITERRTVEEELGRLYVEAQCASLSKDRFLATLAHELRNPLAPVRNAMEILRASDSTAAQRQRAQDIVDRQVSHMARLVDDLLDVSRIKQGKVSLRREPTNLAVMIHRAAENLGHHLAARQHHLTLSLPDVPVFLDVDPMRFHQILCNLLDNAAKYTPHGGQLRLSVKREGDDVLISLRDNGAGIAPDMLSRIFDMFAQAEPTRQRSEGGLGIGLTLSRHLVHLHGGTIDVLSEGLGKGSEFVIRLPNSLCVSHQPVIDKSDFQLPEKTASLRVLLVENEDDVRESLSDVFSLWGHSVVCACNGEEALRGAAATNPEVVFCDIGLPGMDGYEIARRLRDILGPSFRLVALTGFSQPEDRARGRAAGFDLYLVKPANLGELKAIFASVAALRVELKTEPQPAT
jgi:signal transduction histidine kinase/CheY-like chemotaxis protein